MESLKSSRLSLENRLIINNEIIAARYPEILRKGGSTNGKIIINFNEGFTLL